MTLKRATLTVNNVYQKLTGRPHAERRDTWLRSVRPEAEGHSASGGHYLVRADRDDQPRARTFSTCPGALESTRSSQEVAPASITTGVFSRRSAQTL